MVSSCTAGECCQTEIYCKNSSFSMDEGLKYGTGGGCCIGRSIHFGLNVLEIKEVSIT